MKLAKDKYCLISLLGRSFKKVKLTDAESRKVVVKDWWVGDIREKMVKGYKLSAISSENLI